MKRQSSTLGGGEEVGEEQGSQTDADEDGWCEGNRSRCSRHHDEVG